MVRRRPRPWRSRGSWSGEPRRRGGRSSSDPASRPGPGTRSRRACASGRTGSRSPSPGRAARPGRRSPGAARTSCRRGRVVRRPSSTEPADRPARRSSGRSVACGRGLEERRGPGHGCSPPAEPPRPTSRARSSASAPRSAVSRRGDIRQRLGVRRRARPGGPPTPRACAGPTAADAAGSSRASSRCRRVRVWLRGRRRCAPAASRVSAIASPIPPSAAATGSGWSIIWRQALDEREQVAGEVAAVDRRHVLRARAGAGRACRTSCRGGPRNRSRRPIVASVASRRSTMSSVPIQPKSRAVTVASRYIPMFVGEVRWATTGVGSSWKLSGGRPWSSGPTNVSKNRHVRRRGEAQRLDVGVRELARRRTRGAAG